METLKREKATVESLQYLLYPSGFDNHLYIIIMMMPHWSKLLILHAWSCFVDTNYAIVICSQNRQFYFWFNQLGRESFTCSTLIKHMGSSSSKKRKLLRIKEKHRLTNLAYAKLREPSMLPLPLASSLSSVSLRWIGKGLVLWKGRIVNFTLRSKDDSPGDDSITRAKQVCQLSKHSVAQQILSLGWSISCPPTDHLISEVLVYLILF